MGRKTKQLELSVEARAVLTRGYKQSKSAIFSRRCHIILLKSEGRSSKEIGQLLDMTDQAVNHWVKRYQARGIEGLQTKAGQGRKPILDEQTDADMVKSVVRQERQRLKVAKELLEQELGKDFSLLTLKRFLKNLSADGNASD